MGEVVFMSLDGLVVAFCGGGAKWERVVEDLL